MSTTMESASASETKIDEIEEGTWIKGKEFVLIRTPQIRFSTPEDEQLIMSSADTEATADTELITKPCGDGLYYFGGDLFCIYQLLGTTITDTSVVFDYAPYTVTVSWTNSGEGVRTNPTWQRQYKQIENTENEV